MSQSGGANHADGWCRKPRAKVPAASFKLPHSPQGSPPAPLHREGSQLGVRAVLACGKAALEGTDRPVPDRINC